MILVDTGPLVALFDPKDKAHSRCRRCLQGIKQPLYVTVPVLTEVFHMLSPESTGSDRLREFILKQGLNVWFCHNQSLARMFELMVQYADQPMDLADASIVAAAEDLKTQQVFTIDRRDFETYRIRRGHHHIYFEIVS